MTTNDQAHGGDTGHIEHEGHRGDWKIKDGTLTMTCLTMGLAPKTALVKDNPDFLARLLLQEMHREWKLRRP